MITREELEADGWTFNGEVWCKIGHLYRYGFRLEQNKLIVGWNDYPRRIYTIEELKKLTTEL